jgi:RNA polymerase sigma-70 factor (ECF subfamily)
MTDTFRDDIVVMLPHLTRVARKLTRNATLADDMVQDAVERALRYQHRFERGTNLRAWIMTVLRNAWITHVRREARADMDAEIVESMVAADGNQESRVALHEFHVAFRRLPEHQRQALFLVGVQQLSYEDAARTARTTTGTMKSRVSRARDAMRVALAGRPHAAPSIH